MKGKSRNQHNSRGRCNIIHQNTDITKSEKIPEQSNAYYYGKRIAIVILMWLILWPPTTNIKKDKIGYHFDNTVQHVQAIVDYYQAANLFHYEIVAEKFGTGVFWQKLETQFEELDDAFDKHIRGIKYYPKLHEIVNDEAHGRDNELYRKMITEDNYPDLDSLENQIDLKKTNFLKSSNASHAAITKKFEEYRENQTNLEVHIYALDRRGIRLFVKGKKNPDYHQFNIKNLIEFQQMLQKYYDEEASYIGIHFETLFYYFPIFEYYLNPGLVSFYSQVYFKNLRYELIPQFYNQHDKSFADFVAFVELAEKQIVGKKEDYFTAKSAIDSQVVMWEHRIKEKSALLNEVTKDALNFLQLDDEF